MPLPAHEYRDGKKLQCRVFHQVAIGLAIKEISPAADGLAQNQRGRHQIGNDSEGDFFLFGKVLLCS